MCLPLFYVLYVMLVSYHHRKEVDNMAYIQTYGTVTRVIDGDTIEVAVKVRLADIDAPETKGKERPLGLITKDYVSNRLKEEETVKLVITASDKYRRLLADVFIGDTDLGEELLEKHLVEKYSPKNHNNGKLDI